MLLTLVVPIYETACGMPAVPSTDLVLGLILVTELTGLVLAALPPPTHMASVTACIAAQAPEKVPVPGWDAPRCFSALALTRPRAARSAS